MSRGVDEQEPRYLYRNVKLIQQGTADVLDDGRGQQTCPYPLSYLPGFPRRDRCASDLVKKRCLSMINVAEYSHDWLS